MKAAVISLGSKSSEMLAKAMKKYFDDVDRLNIKEIEVNLGSKSLELLYEGEPLSKYDCMYAMGSFRYAPLLRAITMSVEGTTYVPIKPKAFTIAHDKLLTQLDLQMHKIPMPTTYLSSTTEAAKEILEKINYPIIMKFPQGTQGKGVMVADTYASASSMLDALTALKQPFLIQEYIETGGEDIRVFVVGEKVVASMKRTAEIGEMRSNIHAGGKGEACELDAHTKKIAVEAAKAIGADVCGVDVLQSAKGPVVLEVNISPGLQGITAATKVNIAEKIANFLYKKTKEFVESGKKKSTTELFKELEVSKGKKEIITNLDFRGNRILLPEVITNITKFGEKDELLLSADIGKLEIKKSGIGEEKK